MIIRLLTGTCAIATGALFVVAGCGHDSSPRPAETALALLLLLDAWPRYTALASGALLLLFALTMTFALGIKAPLGYSVYVGATAAFLRCSTSRHSARWSG